MNATYHPFIDKFCTFKVLLIGDIIVDAYLKGDSSRLSPEAPVPVVNVTHCEETVGGAANIALNLKALGADVSFVSAVGFDEASEKALSLLTNAGIKTDYIVLEHGRKTVVKSRVMSKNQILARFDHGSQRPVIASTEDELASILHRIYDNVDLILVGDYYSGILTPSVIKEIASLQNRYQKLLAVDSKSLGNFKEVRPTLVKPNYYEAVKLAGLPVMAEGKAEQTKDAGRSLFEETGAKVIALTLDDEGAMIFENGDYKYRSYAYDIPSPNVVGAGDTFISAMSLSFAAGADLESAAEIATAAAAIAVRKEDTAPCYLTELSSFFASNHKLVGSPDDLKKLADIYKQQGKKIVFTNGCFDILHSGHVSYLNRAKELGDVLIVGVNCDESVSRLKGADRPINPLEDRLEVLSGLSAIDHIISFGHEREDTPTELIRAVRPDIFAKGGDYSLESLPEASIVEQLGGRVELVSFVPDHSTTRIIHRINNGSPLKQPA